MGMLHRGQIGASAGIALGTPDTDPLLYVRNDAKSGWLRILIRKIQVPFSLR
jgi:hypothetical protein